MKALVVLAHPEAKSFNGQMRDVAIQTLRAIGAEVEESDLYRMGFDPSEAPKHFRDRANASWFDTQAEQRHAWETNTLPADIRSEIDKIMRADLLLLQCPMWWFGVPAMLKGWLDRVFVYGGLYSGTRRYNHGPCAGKLALLSLTTGAPEPTHAHSGRNGDIELLAWPILFSLYYVGFSVLQPFVAAGVEGGLKYSSPEVLTARLAGHKERLVAALKALDRMPRVAFNAIEDFDPSGQLRPEAPSHSVFIRHGR